MTVRAASPFETEGFVIADGLLAERDFSGIDDALGAWTGRQIAEWTRGAEAPADYRDAFYAAWQVAGRPFFRRSPQRNLTHPGFFAFMRTPALLDAVEEILGTGEISVHGIFNARPMLPEAAVTPWHTDSQYWRSHGEPVPEAMATRTVVTVWVPLQNLDSQLGGLEVASLTATGRRFFSDDYHDPATEFIAIPPAVQSQLHGEVPMLARGGCIFFSALNAHRGTPNRSKRIRWSIDIRYEATAGAMLSGRRFGFVARSRSGRFAEENFETWRARCAGQLAQGAS